MKVLKFLYYISVCTVSFFSVCFFIEVDFRAVWCVVPMIVFLFFVPCICSKIQSKQLTKSFEKKTVENLLTKEEKSLIEKNIIQDQCSAEKEELLCDVKNEEIDDKEGEHQSECVKEFVFMQLRTYGKHGVSLFSEKFESQVEAEWFAEVFSNNYTSRTRVLKAKDGGYEVFADFVPEYLIQSNYRRDNDNYIFANWKFEERRSLPEPPKEHVFDKFPKYEKILKYGVITWPFLGLINFIEWIEGAARVPSDNSRVKVHAQDIDKMNGIDFETYVAKQLRTRGYKNVRVTQASGDFGADILAVNPKGETICIQCKLYSNPVGVKAVQEIYSAKQYYKCNKAMVITNNTYTKAAVGLAKKTDVKLWSNFR